MTKLWSIFLRFWVEQEVHKPRVERRRPEYVVGGMACQGEAGSNGQPDEAARSSLHLAISPTPSAARKSRVPFCVLVSAKM